MARSIHIGINSYPGQPLNGCVNDAKDWAKFFANHGYKEQTVILDSAATKRAIVSKITDGLRTTPSGASIVITYSGHGTWVPDRNNEEIDGRDEAWCPYDLDHGQLILDDELASLISREKKPDSRLLIISDSCHSGTMTRAFPNTITGGRQAVRFLPPLALPDSVRAAYVLDDDLAERDVLPRISRNYAANVVMFSGCGDHEFSYDAIIRNKYNGAFTASAISAFRPSMTLWQWFGAIRRVLPTPQYAQTPQLTGPDVAKQWAL